LSIFTDITIPEIVRDAGYRLDDLEPVFTVLQTYFYIAVSKDTPVEVVQAWQSTLDSMRRDGSFEKIYRRYLADADLDDLLQRGAPP
jgi:polar amino acid transport system substrate-binding protein